MAETRLQSILDRKILYDILIGRVNVDLVILLAFSIINVASIKRYRRCVGVCGGGYCIRDG